MKILVVSYESWRDTNSGGNVLSDILRAFPDADIAQIYCWDELPQNSICQKYFQICESMLLTDKKGRRLEEKDYGAEASVPSDSKEAEVKNKIPSLLKSPALLARELMWEIFNWKTKELESFINEFEPDVIFAPCVPYFHVLKLALHVKSIAKCPIISYVVDDVYSLKKFRFSPTFWINKLIRRKYVKRFFSECSLIYTMTDMQMEEYRKIFRRPMKILCKSADFEERVRGIGSPISFIYAGNLLWKRWKVLEEIAKALADINESEIKAQLHVFSGSKMKPRTLQMLNDGRNSVFHGLIPYSELKDRYKESDVAIFAESFDLKNRLITRLSFSTKIIDCMSSGCAILAIGPGSQAGMAYLKDNDAAICVNRIKDIPAAVRRITELPQLITEYSEKAFLLGKRNHMKEEIEKMLRQDFYDIAAGRAPVL